MGDTVRERIIRSLFNRVNANGAVEETYISHLKIYEEGGPGAPGMDVAGRKARYVVLAQQPNGAVVHKTKENSNGSFSIGKTWNLADLREIELLNPVGMNITFARSYQWQTESQRDQTAFVSAATRLFRRVTGGRQVNVIGSSVSSSMSSVNTSSRTSAPSDSNRSSNVSTSGRSDRVPTPPVPGLPRSAPRNGATSGSSQNTRGLSQRRPSQPSSLRSGSPTPPAMPGLLVPPALRQSSAESPRSSAEHSRESLDVHNGPSASRSSRTRTPSPAPQTPRMRGITPSVSVPQLKPASPPTPRLHAAASSAELSQNTAGVRSTTPPSPPPQIPSIPLPEPTPRPQRRNLAVRTNTASSRVSFFDPPKPDSNRPPSPPQAPLPQRKDPHARISFFDPANQAFADRLLAPDALATSPGLEDESAEATMASVEEMLDGFEWAVTVGGGAGGMSKHAKGAADQIEARLLDELMALEKANIHSFVESDDRIGIVMKYIDDAIKELDEMDSYIQSYKIHLNAVGDDISHIQSQNRGLQVQTQNQKALLNQIEQLLETVDVDREALITLTQESMNNVNGIPRLEEAAAKLYTALLAGRETDMTATLERLEEYRTHNAQFCKRLNDFLAIKFESQVGLLDQTRGTNAKPYPILEPHTEKESDLGRYSGLMLYLKEMDEDRYRQVCEKYFKTMNELYGNQIKALLAAYITLVRKASEEESEMNFSPAAATAVSRAGGTIRRAGTIVRSPLDRKEKDKAQEGEIKGSEAFGRVLDQVVQHVYREEEFMADFLQINDAGLTFADYMGMESFFRRQAARSMSLRQTTLKIMRGAMDATFEFLAAELRSWIDGVLQRDNLQIVGIMVYIEQFMADADERGNSFLQRLLQRMHQRMAGLYERHVDEQIRAIEQTKLTTKKRNGVAHFIKYFPVFVSRVEAQLVGADTLEIRGSVDSAYEKIIQSMFECLQQMAKMDGEGEDKGQLNYHVILIENMHYFVAEIAQQDLGALQTFLKRAEGIYDENLSSYVKLALRRSMAKIMDYFDGIERLLQTTAPSEIPNNSSFNKSALKRIVKDHNAKDIRRNIDALYKRVDKHFAEGGVTAVTGGDESGPIMAGSVMVGVWKACEEELLKNTERFSKLISQCYGDGAPSLEYTAADVEAAFRRHRV